MPPPAVPIAPVGPVAAATLIFREGGLVHVAAIVKATFSFEHHAHMQLAAPEPIFTREVHRMNNPTRSITATSDLVPRLPGADVLLLGQAHAPGGSATHALVRLAVGRGGTAVLDKTVQVVGDRKGSEIKPFRSVPLVYEKAFGGPGYRDNPLGTGALSGDAPPNLLDPRTASGSSSRTTEPAVVGFAPISRSWPARASMVSAEVRAGLDKPVVEIPPGFDFRYFHAAPPDQRIGHLVGDEWIVLENVHPQHPTLHLQLPGAQAMVRVIGADGVPRVFSLRADTLRIDAEAERCTIVWRNSFRVEEAELGALRLFGGVALPGAPIAWPEPAPVHAASIVAPNPAWASSGTMIIEDRAPAPANLGSTMEVSDEDIEAVHDDLAVPDFTSTAILGSTAVPPTAPLPAFMQAPMAPPPPPPARPALRPDPKEGTLDLSRGFVEVGRAASRAVMPFASSAAARPAEPRSAAPIPGSPWDPDRAHALPSEDAPTWELGAADFSSTLASPAAAAEATPPPAPPAEGHTPPEPLEQAPSPPVQASSPPAQAPSPPSSAQAAPPEPPNQAPSPVGDPWGRALGPEGPSPEPAAPPPPPPRPSKGLKEALYKRFKKG